MCTEYKEIINDIEEEYQNSIKEMCCSDIEEGRGRSNIEEVFSRDFLQYKGGNERNRKIKM